MEFHYYVAGCFRSPREDIELGKHAAKQGFDGVWMGDHFLPWLDNRPYTHHALTWLSAFMNEVPDVTVGTFVTCPMFRYHPPVLAQALATIDNLYPGRFEFGVGTGEALNEAPFVDGEWPDWETLADMLGEALDVVDLLWDAEEYVSYEGDHYAYDDVRLYTRPKRPLETHWASWGPRSAYRAGRRTGNLMTASPPSLIENRLRPAFEDGLSDADRSLADANISSQLAAHVGDPAEIVADIRRKGEHTPHDTELDNPDPRDIQTAAEEELARMSDEKVRDLNNVTDDPADLVEEVAALEAAGVTRVLFVSKAGDPYQTVDAISDHVMPEFE